MSSRQLPLPWSRRDGQIEQAEARALQAEMLSALLDAGYVRAPAGWEARHGPDGTRDA